MGAIHEGLHEDILVHRCGACSVLWMAADSLDRLDDNVSVAASQIGWVATGAEGGLACPECVGTYRSASPFLEEVTLRKRTDVVAHRCTGCGSFLLSEATLERVRGVVAGLVVVEPVRRPARDR
jgi:hypothetical protein